MSQVISEDSLVHEKPSSSIISGMDFKTAISNVPKELRELRDQLDIRQRLSNFRTLVICGANQARWEDDQDKNPDRPFRQRYYPPQRPLSIRGQNDRYPLELLNQLEISQEDSPNDSVFSSEIPPRLTTSAMVHNNTITEWENSQQTKKPIKRTTSYYRDEDNIVIIDDANSVLADEVSVIYDPTQANENGFIIDTRKCSRRNDLNEMSEMDPQGQSNVEQFPKLNFQSDDANTCFFRDGARLVDFVLTFQEKGEKNEAQQLRELYERRLETLDLELEYELQSTTGLGYVKIHAPRRFILRQAEFLGIYIPLKRTLTQTSIGSTPYNNLRSDKFVNFNSSNFLDSSTRIYMVYDTMIQATVHWPNEKLQFTLDNLLAKNAYKTGFPTHTLWNDVVMGDATILATHCKLTKDWLLENWAKEKNLFKFQPLQEIKSYFGLKVMVYFAFMGFFLMWLCSAAVMGLAAFIMGQIYSGEMFNLDMFCGKDNVIICRRCASSECTFQSTILNCAYSKFSARFDNPCTVGYALFISIWAAMFPEIWKLRRKNLLAKFKVAEFVSPEIFGSRLESSVTIPRRFVKGFSWGGLIALFLIFCLFAAGLTVGMAVYQAIAAISYLKTAQLSTFEFSPHLLTAIIYSVTNAVVIFVLNLIYRLLCHQLTQLERHRLFASFEISYAYKLFTFQFFNYFGSFFYLLIFRSKYHNATHNSPIFDFCPASSCIGQATIHFIVIFGAKYFGSWILDVLPLLRYATKLPDSITPMWEHDMTLQPCPNPVDFEHYLDLAIFYGFLVLFSAVFPLTPVLLCLYYVFAIRLKAKNLLLNFRRPIPELSAKQPWMPIFECLSKFAMVINALMIALSSDFIDRIVFAFLGYQQNTDYLSHVLSEYKTAELYPSELTFYENIGENITTCFVRGYYERNVKTGVFEPTLVWWQVYCGRFAFFIVFQNVVILMQLLTRSIVSILNRKASNRHLKERYCQRNNILA